MYRKLNGTGLRRGVNGGGTGNSNACAGNRKPSGELPHAGHGSRRRQRAKRGKSEKSNAGVPFWTYKGSGGGDRGGIGGKGETMHGDFPSAGSLVKTLIQVQRIINRNRLRRPQFR